MLVSNTWVMSLQAPTSNHDMAVCEVVVRQIRSVLREATGMGDERFCLTTDFNLELGMLKEEEFVGLYGPFCWRSRNADLISHGTNA